MMTDLDTRRIEAARTYPDRWTGMLSEWVSPAPRDRAWLIYAANYLFCTGGVRWALDPLTLHQRLPSAPAVDLSALAALEYVVLTHRHADHFDPGLLATLRDFPAQWVVPEAMLAQVQTLNLPPEKLTVARPLEPIHLGGLTLTPFDGQHFEADASRPDGLRGVLATGYLVEFNGKRWLFPGDTRAYDASHLPDFGPVDGLFAHLWLGRGAALRSEPPLLEDFCRFCLALRPRRIVISHLEEWGRQASDFWGMEHAEQAISVLKKHAPFLPVDVARTGDTVLLDVD